MNTVLHRGWRIPALLLLVVVLLVTFFATRSDSSDPSEAPDEAAPSQGQLTEASLLTTPELRQAFAKEKTWYDASGRPPQWRQRPATNDQDDCRAELDKALSPAAALQREWKAGQDNRAATVLLEFANRAAADAAYKKVRDGEICGPSGDNPVEVTARRLRLDDGARAVWHSWTAAAPELCTECDSGWIVTQGFVQVDTAIVAVTTAHRGDLQMYVGTAAPWMKRLVQTAFFAVGRL